MNDRSSVTIGREVLVGVRRHHHQRALLGSGQLAVPQAVAPVDELLELTGGSREVDRGDHDQGIRPQQDLINLGHVILDNAFPALLAAPTGAAPRYVQVRNVDANGVRTALRCRAQRLIQKGAAVAVLPRAPIDAEDQYHGRAPLHAGRFGGMSSSTTSMPRLSRIRSRRRS